MVQIIIFFTFSLCHFRSFFHMLFAAISTPYTETLINLDKSHAKHLYQYLKLHVQMLGWGHGNTCFDFAIFCWTKVHLAS